MSAVDKGGQAGSHSDKDPSLEQIDDALREVYELQERWNNRLTLENLRLQERYVQGALKVVLAGRRISDAKQFRAWFQHSSLKVLDRPKLDPDAGLLAQKIDRAGIGEDSPCGDGCAVLIGYVDLVEGDEVRAAPSLIGLDFPEDALNARWGALYFDTKGVFKLLSVSPDWEAMLVSGSIPRVSHGSTDQVIESASGVVGAIADERGEFGGDRRADNDLYSLVGGLRPRIHRDAVKISLPERLNGKLEIKEVLFGPFDLKPWAPKRVSGITHGEFH